MTRPELLVPAGNAACAKAAIQNGADAVYLGLKQGSARAGADNFTWNEFEDTLQYAHKRNCRVYLALNTLFTDTELKDAIQSATEAARLGVDAIIVQDVGLAKHIRHLPTQMHASTQMGVATPEGVRFLKEQGFHRVITARELSIPELAALCKEGLPVECFVHGALCMSYSGQCLLSSFIGGRSGNRGACAQPCRMAYELSTGISGHLLSPKDFCALSVLDKLVKTGVASLKIEGRLKAPEYAALTANIYSKALDHVMQGTYDAYKESGSLAADIEKLELQFSRGHFTLGYLQGKIPAEDITFKNPGRKGLEIGTAQGLPRKLQRPSNLPKGLDLYELPVSLTRTLSPGDGITVLSKEEQFCFGGTVNRVTSHTLVLAGERPDPAYKPDKIYLTHSVQHTEEIRRTFEPGKEHPRVGLTMTFKGRKGCPAVLTLEDSMGRHSTSQSEQAVQQAVSAPTTSAKIQEQLSKLGGTPYYVEQMQMDCDEDIFLPVSILNSLRRDALASLDTCQTRGIEHRLEPDGFSPAQARPAVTPPKERGTTLYFYREEDFLSCDEATLAAYTPFLIYVPYTLWGRPERVQEALRLARSVGAKLIASFPLLNLGACTAHLKSLLPSILSSADGVQLTHTGDLGLLPGKLPETFLVCGDFSLSTTNSASAAFYRDQGVQVLTLSPEAFADEMLSTAGCCFEQITEGPVPLMRTRHCTLRKSAPHCGKCKDGKELYTLTDRRGASYRVLPEPIECQNIILSTEAFPRKARGTEPCLRRINIIKERSL